MENPYRAAPLQVTVYDVSAAAPVQTFVLLGSVPAAVLAAADLAGPGHSWPAGAVDKLQRHYGPGWRRLLTPALGLAGGAAAVTGGDPDLAAFDDDLAAFDADVATMEDAAPAAGPDEYAYGPSAAPPTDADLAAYSGADAAPGRLPTRYSPVATYPEDTFADLKRKVFAATGIPPYRQHLFYAWADSRHATAATPTRTTYQVTVDGVGVPLDIRAFARAVRHGGALDAVAGIPVDLRLEAQKAETRVAAQDTWRTLEVAPGAYVRHVYVADLATLLAPRAAAVGVALRDRYQADLLYYGMAAKYWPELAAPDAFRLAATDPAALAAAYPALAPARAKVLEQLAAEQAIVDNVYAQAKAQAARAAQGAKRGDVAVTEAEVAVEPRGRTVADVRGIFDWVRLGGDVLMAAARLPVDGAPLALVEKVHLSAHRACHAAGLGACGARPAGGAGALAGVVYTLVREQADTTADAADGPQHAYLEIGAAGRYTVSGRWREDDRVALPAVFAQLSRAAAPVIAAVNAMGPAAIQLGPGLETPAAAEAAGRATAGRLTVSAFWPHALTADDFRAMKRRWRAHERAGIVGIAGLQQAGAYTFYFRKGAGAPPADAGGPGNQYAYLTDPDAAARWQQAHAGLAVRIYHRTADLRVEALKVSQAEFARIRAYVFTFLDGLLRGPDRLGAAPGRPAPDDRDSARLRSLQEQDPNLYDLKKYDGATVYSVLCQGDRQPEAFAPGAAKALAPRARAALTPFWNFTKAEPAFYRCPSRLFPHLSFRAGEHPRGYCLPCCKKAPAVPGTKSAAINAACLERLRLPPGAAAAAAAALGDADLAGGHSRHVLSYGKPVQPGRVSHAPQQLAEGLFYSTLGPADAYRLVGVRQSLPGVPAAGFYFALAEALGLAPGALAEALAHTAAGLGDMAYALADGQGAVFQDAGALADAVRGAFGEGAGEGAAQFSPFGPGGPAADSWQDFVADLAAIRFGAVVVVFADALGDGEVVLAASSSAACRILAAEQRAGPATTVAILVSHAAGTYPLVAVDRRAYQVDGDGPAGVRRLYPADGSDPAVAVLYDMIETAQCGCGGADRLAAVLAAAGKAKWRVAHRLINLRGMCYGVVVVPDPAAAPAALVYIPVPYAAHYVPSAADGAPADGESLYGPRPAGQYPAAALARVYAALAGPGAPPPTARLVAAEGGAVVGFIAGGLYYHHDPDSGGALPWAAAPPVRVPYSFADVDRAVWETGGTPQMPPLPPPQAALAAAGMYRHHLYRFFTAEFAALVRGERDAEVRGAVAGLLAKNRAGGEAFAAGVEQALAAHPADVADVQRLATAALERAGPAGFAAAFRDAFGATVFGFDRTTLRRLRAAGAADPAGLEAEVGRMMGAVVEKVPAGQALVPADGDPLPAVYVACSLDSSVPRPQCGEAGPGRRLLRMPADRFAPFVAILAADLLNPMKADMFQAAASNTLGPGLDTFVARPGEFIRVV